jgi:hypothetical protein
MLRTREQHARHAGPKKTWRTKRISGILAAVTAVTAATVAAGVVTAGDATPNPSSVTASLGAARSSVPTAQLDRLRDARGPRISRSSKRVLLKPQAADHKFATAALNVWTLPREHGKRVGLVPWGSRLAVTGQEVGHWAEVLMKGDRVRWVNATYLADKKPSPESRSTGAGSVAAVGGLSAAPCPDGSSVESGLTSGAVRLYRAVCAAFPALTTYGGYDSHGEHSDGRAIDFMITGSAGQAVAEWVRANAGALGVRDIIYAQHIWTPEQAAAGWRAMSDRGSTTANHYDHVHVAVF